MNIQDKLEALQNNLLTTSENANAIGASLSERILTTDQVGFALAGITRDVTQAAQDVEILINEVIEVREALEKL